MSLLAAMPDSTQRFSDRVANYVQYRPSYPEALIEELANRTKLNHESVIADIGAGTGILTKMLLPIAGLVHAIEPNAEMRAAAERDLSNQTGFRSVDGTAEATTLPAASVDLVTAGQAFHWFDIPKTRAEFNRILKPDGQVALIWNERLAGTTPFLAAYDTLLKTDSIDYDQVNHSRIDHTAIERFFSPRSFKEVTVTNEQRFDYPGLAGRALSSSYVPNQDHPRHTQFFEKLKSIFDEHATNGKVSFKYITRLYLGQLS